MSPPLTEQQHTRDPEVATATAASDSASHEPNPTLRYLLRKSEYRHALYSGIITLTLSIMGGAVLPVSHAFTVTGIVCGFFIMLVVASANAYTCDLLLQESYHTGALDYESLAYYVGGKYWKLATEISIVVLLLGTIIGSIQQVSEAAVIGLENISSHVPHWLTGNGRVLMLLSVLFIVAPICLVERMRQLESFATLGTTVVLCLLVVVVVDAIRYKLPAVRNGQLDTTGFSSIGSVTQAISIFGFAFYIQPMMMPFVAEMPPGKVGVKITSYSVRTVVLGTSFFIYSAIGFFGAARYGSETAENILENKWLGGGTAQGVLNLAMSVYLAFAIPTLEFPTRHTINGWIPGDRNQKKFLRHIFISAGILVFCTGISLIWPNNSGNIITITGATGVCMVSYIIPIVNHLVLFFRRAKFQKEMESSGSGGSQVLHENAISLNGERQSLSYRELKSDSNWTSLMLEYLTQVVVPIFVVAVGVFCSVAALTTL